MSRSPTGNVARSNLPSITLELCGTVRDTGQLCRAAHHCFSPMMTLAPSAVPCLFQWPLPSTFHNTWGREYCREQPWVALRVVPSCPWSKGVSGETIVCVLSNENSIITHLHKCCPGNFNPGFPNFLSTWLHNHYKVFMQAFCVQNVSSFKVTWSTRMSKGGESYLGNAKDWNKRFLLGLYAKLFGDKGIWNDCQQRLPTLRSWLL